MTDVAIRVEHLSKRYRIGRTEERPDTLVGAALSWLGSPIQNVRRPRRLTTFEDDGRSAHKHPSSIVHGPSSARAASPNAGGGHQWYWYAYAYGFFADLAGHPHGNSC